MKIRIGYGLGTRTVTNEGDGFGSFVDDLERLGFDSLWLSERISGEAPDPLIALAYAAARTTKLKFGTSVLVVPGRNPVLLAKELATPRPALRRAPAAGLRARGRPTRTSSRRSASSGATGPRSSTRWCRCCAGSGPRTPSTTTARGSTTTSVTVRPRPVQQPIDIWMGGIAPSEIKRVGRLGDGWLPSFCTADDVAQAIPMINQTADEHDRGHRPRALRRPDRLRRRRRARRLAAFVARRRPDARPRRHDPGRAAGACG